MRYHDITKCDMKNGDGLRTVPLGCRLFPSVSGMP